MSRTKKIAEGLSVCRFVTPDELPALAKEFGTIINNRPDGEEPGQPSSAEIETEARRLGFHYFHIPVVAGQISDAQVAEFGEAAGRERGPVLAFCRSGMRSATLWALSQVGKRSVDEILKAAASAGYDLSALKPKLEGEAAAA
jgi:sulfide:quinone oxidoreductase